MHCLQSLFSRLLIFSRTFFFCLFVYKTRFFVVIDNKLTVTQSSEFRIVLYKEKKYLYSVLLASSETPMCVQNSYNGMTPTSDFVWHLYYSVSLVTSVWSYRPTRVPTMWMKTKGFGFRYNLSSQTDSAHYVDVIEQITIVIKNEMRIRLVHRVFFCTENNISEALKFSTLLPSDLITLNLPPFFKTSSGPGQPHF